MPGLKSPCSAFSRLALGLLGCLLAGAVHAAAPTVRLSSPLQGAMFGAPAAITLTAEAADADGTVTQVEFYQGGVLLGAAAAAPYTFTWANVPAGSYSLTARAIDNDGESATSSPVQIVVNADLISGPIDFVYDELGRLVGISEASGKGAVYRYDAAGNVLSITRNAAGSVSIAEFTPNSGPEGAAVAIFGTGFSATPGANTVQFNGVAAAVSSATSNAIIALVPAGAATGPISVSTPNGSATSSTPFVVAASNAPSIASFSPAIAVSGAAVTVSGTNFQTAPANNKVIFNTRLAPVNSAAPSAIATTVPAAAGSGRISVTTPYGKAVSTDDLFIAPSPYTAADVALTGRMAIEESKTIGIGTAGKIGMLVFDAPAAQRIAVRVDSSSMASCGSGTLKILKPDNSALASINLCAGSFLDVQMLSAEGTHTVLLAPAAGATGSVSFTLSSVPPDITGTIAVDGPDVTVTTTKAGQNASLTFTGSAGQRVALQAPTSSFGNSNVFVTIFKPAADGSASTASGNIASGWWSQGSFTDSTVLPASGTYTIKLDPWSALTGSISLRLSSVPDDVTAPITLDGPDVTVTTTRAGQNAFVTFSGSAGQRVALFAPTSTFGNSNVFVTIFKPAADGTGSTANGNIGSGWWSQGTFSDVQVLPASGTYTVKLDPWSTLTGTMTMRLFSVPDDLTAPISVDGADVSVTTTKAGQNAFLTFSGTAGQRVALLAPGSTFGNSNVFVTIFKPAADGTGSTANGNIGSGWWSQGTFSDVQVLPATGTYTVKLDPWQMLVGTMSMRLFNVPPDATGTIAIDGPDVTVTTTAGAQNARLTFSGTAGQRIALQAISSSYTSAPALAIYKPAADGSASTANGTVYNTSCCFGSGSDTGLLTLPASGTYTIYVNPPGTVTGNITLRLKSVPDEVAGTIASDGPDVTAATTAGAQNARLTFGGTAGQRIALQAISSSYTSAPALAIYKPAADGSASTANGTVYSQSCCFGSGSYTDVLTLPANGTYTIYIDPPGTVTGSITLRLKSVPDDVAGTTAIDGPDVTVATTAGAQNARLTFSGTAGQRIALQAISSSYTSAPALTIYKPAADGSASTANGTVYSQSCCFGSGSYTDVLTLPASGTYTIFVNPPGTVTGSMSLRLASVPDDITSTIAIGGPDVTVTTTAAAQNARLAFTGTAGQQAKLLGVTSSYSSAPALAIYKPAADGSASTANGTVYNTSCCFGAGANTGLLTLPASGIYTIYVNPPGTVIGSMMFRLTSQ